MLKIPKVTIETMQKITEAWGRKEDEGKEKYVQRLQSLLEEFASEQPALLSMISQMGEIPTMTVAMTVYKIIKTECENSTLQSFLDN